MKLENILVDENGYLIVIDFGISKKIEPDNESATVCGTANNMAPEIFGNKGYNKSVDWWAVGIMIFELIFGKHPFNLKGEDLSQQETFDKIATKGLKFPDQNKYKIKYTEEM